jgi:hypothetical protein
MFFICFYILVHVLVARCVGTSYFSPPTHEHLNKLLKISNFRRVRKISWLLASSYLSVRPRKKNSASTVWGFMKFDIWAFFEYLPRKFRFI